MATYYFDLKINGRLISDHLGTELPNDAAAHAHACEVAHELMRHRESKSRHWRLCVRRNGGALCFEVLFAAVDHSMDALDGHIRGSVVDVCGNMAGLSEAIGELQLTISQVKATMARADAELHLVAIDGMRL